MRRESAPSRSRSLARRRHDARASASARCRSERESERDARYAPAPTRALNRPSSARRRRARRASLQNAMISCSRPRASVPPTGLDRAICGKVSHKVPAARRPSSPATRRNSSSSTGSRSSSTMLIPAPPLHCGSAAASPHASTGSARNRARSSRRSARRPIHAIREQQRSTAASASTPWLPRSTNSDGSTASA